MLPLALVGLLVTAIVGFILVVLAISWFSNPPFGLGNAPPQPIAFPHTVHAGLPAEGGVGIPWVHRLPDHVRFVHEAHIRFLTQGESREVTLPIGDEQPMQLPLTVGESCSVCHGNVAGMTEVQPQTGQSLKMGTCVDCHKTNNVATDCTICHK